MPLFWKNMRQRLCDNSQILSHSNAESRTFAQNKKMRNAKTLLSKTEVIQHGLDALQQAGTTAICRVCIPSGGSCCHGCDLLVDGVGCSLRNTSCTAWLCGYLKFIFYDNALLPEWNAFWEQIPGQEFRRDFTPSQVAVNRLMEIPNIQHLTTAFAEDLAEHSLKHPMSWIIDFKDHLDATIDRLSLYTDSEINRSLEKRLQYMTRGFKRYHLAKEAWLNEQAQAFNPDQPDS